MTISNDQIFAKAQEIAARRRDGGSFVKYIDRARSELQEPSTELRKVVAKSTFKDEQLHKKAALAKQARLMPTGRGNVDPDARIEVGEVETALVGRVRVSISSDSFEIHGVNLMLDDVNVGLRGALVAASATFSNAENAADQVDQRVVIGDLVDAIMRRNKTLESSVRASKQNERFGV